jgi:transketolase N-terminal domain/subunit
LVVTSGTFGDFVQVGNGEADPPAGVDVETGHAGQGFGVRQGVQLGEDICEIVNT